MLDVAPAVAFAMSQTQAPLRYRWDPFVREQRLINATAPGKGVRTFTRSRHFLTMVSEYTTYHPPTHVGMKMVRGPWFFGSFAGGWNFRDAESGRTEATWRYTFTIRPAFLRPVADRIGSWLLGRDIRRRIAGFARAFDDPDLVAAAEELARR